LGSPIKLGIYKAAPADIAGHGCIAYARRRVERKSEMTVSNKHSHRPPRQRRGLRPMLAVAALGFLLVGCADFTQVYQRGYVLPEGALEHIPMGATQEQVLIVLGTPSTVATVSGEAFYYISQRGQQSAAFMPQKVVEQRVIVVYFDKNRRVERLADYGLKDGKVFDSVSRTTPTSGQELSYLNYMFKILGGS
jgi:outer membrane protein assembly factor BamE (lipoprotein component of BamABCDE complex)